MTKPFDVAIIGGGINGCGCAADAALRGLSVVLCEKDDLASKTSSSSSKLIHGGLRYLEQFDFSLVKKALNERQIMLNIAPHIVHPLKFILPQDKHIRSHWMLRIGLFLYDNLSRKNQLTKSSYITRKQNPDYFKPLIPTLNQGFAYYDCTADDARLTITNAIQAKQHNAEILTHTEVTHADIIDNIWHLTVQTKNQKPSVIRAKTLINAAGPYVEGLNQLLNIPNKQALSLVKGSHIVLKSLYKGNFAYVLQHNDKRIVFTIPYLGHTLIGTTEIPITGSLDSLQISPAEIDYLLDTVAKYFNKKPKADQIITSWSGVRPLLSNPDKTAQTLTRDYCYHYSAIPAPCVTIYGGKITTYRLLASKVIDTLDVIFPNIKPSKTDITLLPGAPPDSKSIQDYHLTLHHAYPWLNKEMLNHYLQTYGSRAELILKGCSEIKDLGEHIMGPLYQREVEYLIKEEWATSADDILWRRTKLGLDFNQEARLKLNAFL